MITFEINFFPDFSTKKNLFSSLLDAARSG